jgi:malonate transporter and related proteins
VFFPALLSETLIRADLARLPLGAITATMVLSFFSMAIGLLIARRRIMAWLAIEGPSFSSLFQNATRWNGFIALPILAKLYGDEGVALVAIVMGALVPLANFAAVIVVARNAQGRRLTHGETIYVVFRNPFIWATAIGLLINLLRIPIYAPVLTALSMLGGAGIGTGLLMVGAGLHAAEAMRPSPAVWLGTGLKLLGTPVLVTLWSFLTGVSGTAFVACMVCAAVPTAMSAYVLARQMGGDAPLVAATVTLQTVLSFVSIPLLVVFAQWLS